MSESIFNFASPFTFLAQQLFLICEERNVISSKSDRVMAVSQADMHDIYIKLLQIDDPDIHLQKIEFNVGEDETQMVTLNLIYFSTRISRVLMGIRSKDGIDWLSDEAGSQ
jgi:hypothetical protein